MSIYPNIVGYVVVYKDENGRSKEICQIPMATDNAVILPELIEGCCSRARNG